MARFLEVGDGYDRAAHEARTVIEGTDPLTVVFDEVDKQLGFVGVVLQKSRTNGDGEDGEERTVGRPATATHCVCCQAKLGSYHRPIAPRGGIRYKRDRCAACQRHRDGHCSFRLSSSGFPR